MTGLAGGFGYNRSLQLPDITGVESYPLVAGAMGKLDASQTEYKLNELIQVAPNQDWLAAGVRFTSATSTRHSSRVGVGKSAASVNCCPGDMGRS